MFDPSLASSSLAFVEEKKMTSEAYDKLKAWVMQPGLVVKRMSGQPIPPHVHFVQVAADANACPILRSDL